MYSLKKNIYLAYLFIKGSLTVPLKRKQTTYFAFLGGHQAIFLGEITTNFSFHLDISRSIQFGFSEKHPEISPRLQIFTGENG